jgi:hypothetical protein
MGQCAAQAFITDNLVHAEYLWGDFVTPQTRDMRVATLSIED